MTTNLFDSYFHYVANTEPPMIYHRWALTSILGTILGRQCWFPFGASRIFPNQYIMLIGTPGTRKSTSIKTAKRVLSQSGYNLFSAERTSKEKFLLDLQGEQSAQSGETITSLFGDRGDLGAQEPREVFICADEFNEFTGSGNIEFLSMLGALWDWDDPETPYKQSLKSAKSSSIYQPTINILAGNTHSGFAQAFPVDILGQGFMSRLVLIYSEPSGRKITIPTVPNPALLESIVRELLAIKMCVQGPMTISKEAYSALDTIYKTWPELEDTRFKHYSTRRLTHLIKNIMVVAAANHRTEMQVRDVILANTILTYAELHMSKAMGELGRKRGSDASTLIMSVLYEAIEPLELLDIWKKVDKDVDSMAQLAQLVNDLHTADKVQVVKITGTNRKGFLPKQRNIGRKNLYIDLDLLKGVEL